MNIATRQRIARRKASVDTEAALPSGAAADDRPRPSLRYGDRSADPQARLFGIFCTALIAFVIAACGLLSWRIYTASQPAVRLAAFDIDVPAAPPEPNTEVPPGPEQVQREKAQPEPVRPEVTAPEILTPGTSQIVAEAAPPVVDPGPPQEKTSAPESKPVPPAQKASDARPTWEGMVLGALNKVKRHPREAAFRHQQGVPWIRFTMSRDGKVRSVRLERSSGAKTLDDEALSLPKRASPLPKPPEDVTGETIELVVPVEFFMR